MINLGEKNLPQKKKKKQMGEIKTSFAKTD